MFLIFKKFIFNYWLTFSNLVELMDYFELTHDYKLYSDFNSTEIENIIDLLGLSKTT